MAKIEIITSITGGKDQLIDDQVKGNAKFICYTDDPSLKSDVWEIRPAYDKFKDPRRNSRIHKILIHKYSDADITIWIDGNTRFVAPPEVVVDKYLGDYDMAMFKHGGRNCIYDEAMECARLGLDSVETIIEQAKYYEDKEFPKQRGLMSGYFIIRRNNQKTKDLNEAWWADYCRFSRRDQISLMPAVDKVGVRINPIPEKWVQHDGFASMGGVVAIRHHMHFEGNFNEIK
jgi:hypothetical protein